MQCDSKYISKKAKRCIWQISVRLLASINPFTVDCRKAVNASCKRRSDSSLFNKLLLPLPAPMLLLLFIDDGKSVGGVVGGQNGGRVCSRGAE